MAVKYVLAQKGNPGKLEAPKKFYAQAKPAATANDKAVEPLFGKKIENVSGYRMVEVGKKPVVPDLDGSCPIGFVCV